MRSRVLGVILVLVLAGCRAPEPRGPASAAVDPDEAASCAGKSITAHETSAGAPYLEVTISCIDERPILEDLTGTGGAPRELSPKVWAKLWTEVDAADWRNVPEQACAGGQQTGEEWRIEIVEPDGRRALTCSGVTTLPAGAFARIVSAVEAATK